MEEWANLYSGVRFLTVCVDVLGVAFQFGRMFGLQKAINCFIPSKEYFPRGYGQLGCSGFIVSDQDGCFVTAKTMPYLQYGDAAFAHVEKILLEHFGQSPCIDLSHDPTTIESKTDDDINQPVPSVGIKSMDAEHERCEEALSQLQTKLTFRALENVLLELSNHFSHEEQLMETHGFGKSAAGIQGGFSPLVSHANDHQRILTLVSSELARCARSASCSSEGTSP
mmetsp:Transcript_28902/g.42463  ORF Transcript_28902/g.42463 Transcript_28902/m.42463 type:complete len:225 (-) Transcript_28902:373-1047(-)